jgi:hypothetical protein
MALIIKVADYGYRKAIKVCLNPDELEAVHIAVDGTKEPHTGDPPAGTDPLLKTWEWCLDCKYNWTVREFLWTGADLNYKDARGNVKTKTNVMIKEELAQRLAADLLANPPVKKEIAGLLGNRV